MADYDSILKEKKNYEEPISTKDNGPKPFPWFKIDLLCLILILTISYIIYYTTILTPKQIFLNDIKIVANKYQSILEQLNLEILNKPNYNLVGTINLNDKTYDFSLNKTEDKTNLNLTLNKENLTYYDISSQKYIKLSNFKDQYYQLTNNDNNYLNIASNLKKYLTNNLNEDKFIKKFYLTGTTPIVESNLVLNNNDIKTALNLTNQNDSYEVLFTFKNHAITNKIINMKITINNLTTSQRGVILYENGHLTYNEDTQILKFQLEEKNKDFTLKFYKDDILFSVLTGTSQEKSYQYTYQVIDKIYNITLNISKENNNNNYKITSKIEKDGIINTQNLNINLQYSDKIKIENTDLSNAINYETLTEEEKNQYQTSINNIIGDLRNFIDQHQ